MKNRLFIIMLCLFGCLTAVAQDTKVPISVKNLDNNPILKDNICKTLSDMFSEFNRCYEVADSKPDLNTLNINEQTKSIIHNLWGRHHFKLTVSNYEFEVTKVLNKEEYIVFPIIMQEVGRTNVSEFIICFTNYGLITKFERKIDYNSGNRIVDETDKMLIHNFIVKLAKAYCEKDITFLRKVYCIDNSLFIMDNTAMREYEYLNHLQNKFNNNCVNAIYGVPNDIKALKTDDRFLVSLHPLYTGNIRLIIDLRDKNNPKITFRESINEDKMYVDCENTNDRITIDTINYYYSYHGEVLKKNHKFDGQGTMLITKQHKLLNTSIIVQKGDIIKGEFVNGNIVKFTQIDTNGDTICKNYTWIKNSIFVEIDNQWDTTLKNKRIPEMILSRLLTKINSTYDNNITSLNLNGLKTKIAKEATDKLLAIYNTISPFYYDSKKHEGKFKTENYKSNEFGMKYYLTIPIHFKKSVIKDGVKSKDAKLNIVYNEKWDIVYFDYKMIEPEVLPPSDSTLILKLLEDFRIAYGHKDIRYLKQVFDENATIIVGKVDKNGNVAYREDTISDDYLNRLEYDVFKQNKTIRLEFKDIKVTKVDSTINKYRIVLHQHWKATFYHDLGYLQMLWKLDKQNQKAIIFMREWSKDGKFSKDKNFFRTQ